MASLIPALLIGWVRSAMAEVPPTPRAPDPVAAGANASDGAAAIRPGPGFYWVAVPPLLQQAGIRDIPAGPGLLQVELNGGYTWRSQAIYRTDTTTLTELSASQGADLVGGTLWGRWAFSPRWSLRLAGTVLAGGPIQAPGYDPTLVGGISATLGPAVQYSTLNDTAFPTAGSLLEAGWAGGYHWGLESLAFQLGWLEGQHYLELGKDQTVAFRILAKAGGPRLSWVDKIGSGSLTAVRGYVWNRFTGDRQLVGTAEYRHLVWPKLLSVWGLDLGLGWTAFVDVGRAWESSNGVPFPNDIRPGVGLGVYGTLNRATIGVLSLSVGNEGVNPAFYLGKWF